MRLREDLAGQGSVIEIAEWAHDDALKQLVDRCIATQRAVACEPARAVSAGDDSIGAAKAAVSREALAALRSAGRDIHGIARESDIAQVVTFNGDNIEDAVVDAPLQRLRHALDAAIGARVGDLFPHDRVIGIDSGHFWYPPGGYMGWHTNSQAPGWRLYVTRTDEPGRSFFRYRDPQSGEIHTSLDADWNFRLFRIQADDPFWHAVYSETNRFSFGTLVVPRSPRLVLRQQMRRVRARLVW
jgi:hypothetical protein